MNDGYLWLESDALKTARLSASPLGSGIFVDKLAELSYIVRHENKHPHNQT
jgi:hypothetical protein